MYTHDCTKLNNVSPCNCARAINHQLASKLGTYIESDIPHTHTDYSHIKHACMHIARVKEPSSLRFFYSAPTCVSSLSMVVAIKI